MSRQSTFAMQVADFANRAKVTQDKVFRAIVTQIAREIIQLSPVGNPELWEQNRDAASYNKEVANYNSELRQDPANLTKRGRLKAGLLLVDGMDIKAPAGYVGGRFRGNWQLEFDSRPTGTLERIDPTGNETMAAIIGQMPGLEMGMKAYLVNNLLYAIELEYGHSKQAPSGMVRITVERFQNIVRTAVQEHRQ